MRTKLLRLGSALVATLAVDCLDPEPLPFHPREAGVADVDDDAADEDAISDGADPKAVCRACIEAPADPGPGCSDQYLACIANEKCLAIFECVLAGGCTSKGTQPEIINCALPCVADAGAVNIGDPAVQLILPIAPCVLGPCKPSCGGGQSMKPTRSTFSQFLAAAVTLAVTLTSGIGGSADDVAVPAELQATLLAKVMTYDRNLSERAGDRVHILVVGKPTNPTSMPFSRQMRQVLSSTQTVGSLPHDEEIFEFTSTAALVEKCRAHRIAVAYFGPGFEGDVEAIRTALEPLPIMTVSAVPELVPRGLVLGFDLVYGRPKLVVHLTQARKQKVDLSADVLKLMRVFE